jgi:hypothetical protein
MDGLAERSDAMIRSGVRRLTIHHRGLFIAEVTVELCGGSITASTTRSSDAGRPWSRSGMGCS